MEGFAAMNKQVRMTTLGLACGFLSLVLLLGHRHFDGFRFAHPATAYQWGYDMGQAGATGMLVLDLACIVILLYRLVHTRR